VSALHQGLLCDSSLPAPPIEPPSMAVQSTTKQLRAYEKKGTTTMAAAKQPEDAQHHVECTIAALDEIETELEAEKKSGACEGLYLVTALQPADRA